MPDLGDNGSESSAGSVGSSSSSSSGLPSLPLPASPLVHATALDSSFTSSLQPYDDTSPDLSTDESALYWFELSEDHHEHPLPLYLYAHFRSNAACRALLQLLFLNAVGCGQQQLCLALQLLSRLQLLHRSVTQPALRAVVVLVPPRATICWWLR